MARFLFANFPADGHINPMLPVVRRLVARGHDVLWYTGERFRPKIEKAGATYLPLSEAPDYSLLDPVLDSPPEQRELTGIKGLKWDIRHSFIDSGVGQHNDLRAIYDAHDIDLVVGASRKKRDIRAAPEYRVRGMWVRWGMEPTPWGPKG